MSDTQTDSITLSVCIPTWNRADFLDLCLATVLPQVAEHSDRVECVIRDNASDDHTWEVIERYAAEFPANANRNEINKGGLANFLDVAIRDATGDYIWLIGDDDALNEGAMRRILDFIDEHNAEPDLIALNVGYLPKEERPTASAGHGGIQMNPDYTLRSLGESEIVSFSNVFEADWADLTAVYSFILRRSCWAHCFADWQPLLPMTFETVEETYPHAVAAARTQGGKRVGLIREPSVSLFAIDFDQSSWARDFPRNTLLRAEQLYRVYEEAGVSKQELHGLRSFHYQHAKIWLPKMIRDPEFTGGWKDGIHFACLTRGFRARLFWLLFKTTLFRDPENNWFVRKVARGITIRRRILTYLFRECRPARWFHARFTSNRT